MPKRNLKIVLFWILGTVCIFIGAMIVSSFGNELGTNLLGLILAFLISFVLFLLGGLLWISVAIAAKKVTEE